MTGANARTVLWCAQILGVLVSFFVCFLAIGTLDREIAAFLVQVTPCMFMLLAVAVSSRRAWVGAVVFILLAQLYGAVTTSFGRDWVMVIAPPHSDVIFIPSIVVGLLFLWSWRHAMQHSQK